MYSSAIPLKDLTLKVGRKALLYQSVTAYDNVKGIARFAFIIINVKSMINDLAAKDYGIQKGTITSWVVQYTPGAVLYSTLFDHIFRS